VRQSSNVLTWSDIAKMLVLFAAPPVLGLAVVLTLAAGVAVIHSLLGAR